MMHAVLSLLLLTVVFAPIRAAIQPTFSCWFTSYATGSPIPTIILGYANTNSSDVTATINSITPSNYDTNKPTLFKAGGEPFAIILGLTSNESVTWTIDGLSRTVLPITDLTSQNRCINSIYANSCPTSILNFCEDGSYCNGNEICFPDVLGGSHGACHQTTEVVVCPNDLVCSDTVRACISPTTLPPPTLTPTSAPTMAPTMAPTTPIHTEAPTTVPPTNVLSNESVTTAPPTENPTERVIAEETTCQSDEDCNAFTNFCQGQFVCNQLTSLCIQSDANYDPCYSYRTTLRNYYASTNSTSFPISITCHEEAKLCVESFTCRTNLDCSDNLLCNGEEICVSGQCYYQEDQSISAVCHTTLPSACNEPDGCSLIGKAVIMPNHPSNSSHQHHSHNGVSPVVVAIIVGVVVFIGFVILMGILYFEFNQSAKYSMGNNEDQVLVQSQFQSKFRGKLNTKYGFKQA